MAPSEYSQPTIPSTVNGHVQPESCRQRLNPQGKAIIEDFLNKNIRIGTSITSGLKRAVVQQVVGAGNSKFKMNNLLYYITKRQGEYLETYAADTSNKETQQSDSNKNEPPYHLISKNARKNIRRLIQEAKSNPNSWAREYIDKIHLAISYFDYIDAGGEDTFDSDSSEPYEAPPETKERTADEQEQMRADRVEMRPNGPGGSAMSLMNEDGQKDQTQAEVYAHLPTPVSPEGPSQSQLQSQPQPLAQRSSSAILIRTDRGHTNRMHTPYFQLRKHAASPEARAVVSNVKQEPPTPNEPSAFQHPLSPTPSAPDVNPVTDHASPIAENHDVKLTRAGFLPSPKSRREGASSTGCGHVESTQGRQQNVPSAPAQEKATGALHRSSLATSAKQKLINIANCIDDFRTGAEGIRTVNREHREEFVRAGGELGNQVMDVGIREARRTTLATINKSNMNDDERNAMMLKDGKIDELSNIDIDALLAKVTAGSRSSRSPIEPSIALGDVAVQHVDNVQGSMDIDLEPAPTCYRMLLEWISKYQVQIDTIISFGQQVKAAKQERGGH